MTPYEQTRREIAIEADRVLAEHYTLAEIAQEPDMQAKFSALSARGQRFVDMVIPLIDSLPIADARAALVALGVPIGEIAGETVYADYSEDGELFGADLEWNGLNLRTDGYTYLRLGVGEECEFYGDMTLPEWGKVRELASTTVVEQLIALARSKARRAA